MCLILFTALAICTTLVGVIAYIAVLDSIQIYTARFRQSYLFKLIYTNEAVVYARKVFIIWNAAFNRLLRFLCNTWVVYTKKIYFSPKDLWNLVLSQVYVAKTAFLFSCIDTTLLDKIINKKVISMSFGTLLVLVYNTKFTVRVFLRLIAYKLISFLKNSFSFKSLANILKNLLHRLNAWIILINHFLLGDTPRITPFRGKSFSDLLLKQKNIANFRTSMETPSPIYLACFSIYKNLRSIILPFVLSAIFFVILIDFFSVDFLRQCGVWAVFGFLAFWLFSTFNFFIKRYRYGKFTSAIQRFWKRTNAYFWIIEGFMFSLFFYYYLNSSQEPLYMYDESNLNQQFLPSLVASYQSYLLLLFIFFYTLYLMLSLPTFKSTHVILHLGLMTLAYTYIYLLESYQVYYLLTSFYENFWVYDAEQALWSLEIEIPRIRTKQQYFYIALVLKFWHFVFIYLSWLFVAMKAFEKKQISYVLLSLSSQNILILFTLNILFNAQWIKWVIRRFYETAYYWFFTAPNEFTLVNFIQELIITCQLYDSTFKNLIFFRVVTVLFL